MLCARPAGSSEHAQLTRSKLEHVATLVDRLPNKGCLDCCQGGLQSNIQGTVPAQPSAATQVRMQNANNNWDIRPVRWRAKQYVRQAAKSMCRQSWKHLVIHVKHDRVPSRVKAVCDHENDHNQ